MLGRVKAIIRDPRMSGNIVSKIMRIASWEWVRLQKKTDITVYNGSTPLVANYDDGVARLLYYFRDFEGVFQDLIAKNQPKGGCFVDVGANIGLFAQVAAQAVGPEGEVIAFEPNPHAFRRLEHNVAAFSCVTAHNKAVGDTAGELHFKLAADTAQCHLVDAPGPNVVTVPGCRLDDELGDRHVDILKIDVEGFEIGVLRGADKLLSDGRADILQIEVSHEAGDIFDFVTARGYAFFICRDGTMRSCADRAEFDRLMEGRTWNCIACKPEKSDGLIAGMKAYYAAGGL